MSTVQKVAVITVVAALFAALIPVFLLGIQKGIGDAKAVYADNIAALSADNAALSQAGEKFSAENTRLTADLEGAKEYAAALGAELKSIRDAGGPEPAQEFGRGLYLGCVALSTKFFTVEADISWCLPMSYEALDSGIHNDVIPGWTPWIPKEPAPDQSTLPSSLAG